MTHAKIYTCKNQVEYKSFHSSSVWYPIFITYAPVTPTLRHIKAACSQIWGTYSSHTTII